MYIYMNLHHIISNIIQIHIYVCMHVLSQIWQMKNLCNIVHTEIQKLYIRSNVSKV
jgi:hypothetical protein